MSCLPLEVVDEIVNYLKSDKSALKSCSLASRIFLPRARLLLFGTLSFRPDNSEKLFEVAQRAPHLIRYSKIVHIANWIPEEEGNQSSEQCIEWVARQDRLPDLLSNLGQVDNLQFTFMLEEPYTISWNDLPQSLVFSLTQIIYSQSLTTLIMTGIKFPDFRDLHSMLEHCIKLRTLGMHELTFDMVSSIEEMLAVAKENTVSVKATLKKLDIMCLSNRDCRAFLNYFCHSRCPLDVQKLSSLTIEYIPDHGENLDLDHCREFTFCLMDRQSSPYTLKHLTLDRIDLWFREIDAPRIYNHKGLTSLDIGMLDGGTITFEDEILLSLMKGWPSDHPMSSLAIGVSFDDVWDGDMTNWSTVSATLSRLQNLRKLDIYFMDDNMDKHLESVRDQAPFIFTDLLKHQGLKEINLSFDVQEELQLTPSSIDKYISAREVESLSGSLPTA